MKWFAGMLMGALLGLAAYSPCAAGEAVYFDAQGNRITGEQYNAINQSRQEEKAAQMEALRLAREARARELARQRAKRRREQAQAAAGNQAPQATDPSNPEAIIDRMIQQRQTGASSTAPPTSGLLIDKCYTYHEIFSMAEDIYVEHIGGRSVIKQILMNGVWRMAEPCGEDGFKVGKRLPHLKEVTWSWNKLNPKRKTGGCKEE